MLSGDLMNAVGWQEEMEEDQPEAQDNDDDNDQGRRSRDEEIIDF
jgi:hypothetical protein